VAPASVAAVAAPVPTIQVVIPPAQLVPIMGAPSIARVSWDRSRPDPVDVTTHGQAAFLPWNLQGEVVGSPATPFVLAGIPPLLPRTQGGQPLSRRERSWINEPVLRPVRIIGRLSARQLQVRTQLREAILVTRAGRAPPQGEECHECQFTRGDLPFADYISGGLGQKCNNCLYRGHVRCSLES